MPMTEITEYRHGTPSWVDLTTDDVAGARRFYQRLFGWKAEPAGGPEAGGYELFKLRGLDVAGLGPQSAEQAAAGAPAAWSIYVTVDRVDAAAERVEAAGGTLLAKPFDVMTAGRLAVAADPAGGVFCLWQAHDHIGARIVNEPGSLCWTELQTRDPAGAARFYGEVLGWETRPPVAAETPTDYHELYLGERSVAGMMPIPDDWGDVPTNWTPYFAVDDCDAFASRAAEIGGAVVVDPFDIPVGRMAVLRDPQGANFAAIRLQAPTP